MNYTTLVGVNDLAAHIQDPGWVVCDCRHDLMSYESGRQAYARGHVPGARFLHLDEDLSGPKNGRNGRHPLPHPITFTLRMGALGVDNRKQVVAYDASGGCFAARLWWMLRWVGHNHVAVLDGGWDAWLRSAHAVSMDPPVITSAMFNPGLQPQSTVDAAFIVSHLNRQDIAILDARSADRFCGENETLDPVGGHIPGAVNRFFRHNLDESGRFKRPAALELEFGNLLGNRMPGTVVHQCGSGVTACHNLLAMEIAGLNGSRLYPGSWSEWCSDGARPVAQGSV
jgi:thiosulfate/3-mercaptopyruvate sulfurtransferase